MTNEATNIFRKLEEQKRAQNNSDRKIVAYKPRSSGIKIFVTLIIFVPLLIFISVVGFIYTYIMFIFAGVILGLIPLIATILFIRMITFIIKGLNYRPILLGYEDELPKGADIVGLPPEYDSYENAELTYNSQKAELVNEETELSDNSQKAKLIMEETERDTSSRKTELVKYYKCMKWIIFAIAIVCVFAAAAEMIAIKNHNSIKLESTTITKGLYGSAMVIALILVLVLVISSIFILIFSANINSDVEQYNDELNTFNASGNNLDENQNTTPLNKVTYYGFIAIVISSYIAFIIFRNLPNKPKYGQLVSDYKNYVLYTLIVQIIVLLIVLYGYALDKKRINKE